MTRNRLLVAAFALLAISIPFIATSTPDPAPAPPMPNAQLDEALGALGYTVVPLRKTALNEYELEATINGSKKITLEVSFQSVSTLLDTETLEELGLEYEETGQEFRIGRDEEDAYVVRTDSMNIGNGRIGPEELFAIEFDEFDAFEDSRVGGILGREFLIKYSAVMDFADNKLYIKTR